MRLPGHEQAVIDPAKLIDYCLNPNHSKGKHKARVFRSALGLTPLNWTVLRDAIIAAIATQDAVETEEDALGRRYRVDFTIAPSAGSASVRSCWIIRRGEDFPRLPNSYVLI